MSRVCFSRETFSLIIKCATLGHHHPQMVAFAAAVALGHKADLSPWWIFMARGRLLGALANSLYLNIHKGPCSGRGWRLGVPWIFIRKLPFQNSIFMVHLGKIHLPKNKNNESDLGTFFLMGAAWCCCRWCSFVKCSSMCICSSKAYLLSSA